MTTALVNTKLKAFLMAGLLVTASLGLQGCTEEDTALAIGIVAGAVIVSALDDDGHSHHSPQPPRYVDCNLYSNRYDSRCQQRPGFRPVPHRPGHPGYGPRGFVAMNTTSAATLAGSPVEAVAQKYSLTNYAAEKLVNALDKATKKDYTGVDDLGILRSDVIAIYENKGATRYTHVNLGSSLGISYDEAKVLVSHISSDIQAEKARLEIQ